MNRPWRRRLAEAMVLALTGSGSGASRIAEAAISAAESKGDPELFARFQAVATGLRAADHASTADFADACVDLAREIAEPGWEAAALALRVVVQPTWAEDEQMLEDLVSAEDALRRCDDPDLAWSGHIALGLAYQAQRLFELAIVHHETALEGPGEPFGLRAARMLPVLHLGETHLHWADELDQLGEDRHRSEVQEHRWLAAELAREAVRAAEAHAAGPAVVNEARMLEICASWEDDPVAAGDELGEAVESQPPSAPADRTHERRARLAQIYAARGETERATECAESAMTDLASAHDPRTEARVRYVAVSLAADGGDIGSRSGLECAQSVARSWWATRLSRLHSIQRVLINEDLIRRNHRYRREAREDALTGSGNRRALDERLAELTGTGEACAVVVVDVDDFKTINDTHGHLRGDEALCAAAGLLTDHVRGDDLVARTGGDEFVMVLRAADHAQTTELVNRLRLALLDLSTVSPSAHLQALRLSFGWAATSEGLATGALLATADARMYAAKRSKPGRGEASAQPPRPVTSTS